MSTRRLSICDILNNKTFLLVSTRRLLGLLIVTLLNQSLLNMDESAFFHSYDPRTVHNKDRDLQIEPE